MNYIHFHSFVHSMDYLSGTVLVDTSLSLCPSWEWIRGSKDTGCCLVQPVFVKPFGAILVIPGYKNKIEIKIFVTGNLWWDMGALF